MDGALRLDGDDVATALGELLDVAFRPVDHQMGIEHKGRARTQVLDEFGSKGDVRDEIPVHDVQMDPFRRGRSNRTDLFRDMGEVCREDTG